MNENESPTTVLAKHLLEDSTLRVRYQHEFSLAGFKSLILINGGAIIALLTYVGNQKTAEAAHQLKGAFMVYVAGLVATILAYLFAYMSQGFFMNFQMKLGIELMGLKVERPPKEETIGNWFLRGAIALTVGGLAAFVIGSFKAMSALG